MRVGSVTMESAADRLRRWIEFEGLTLAQAGSRLGVSHTMVHLVANGQRRPGLELAVRIETVTARWPRGPIAPWEWVESGTAA